VFSGLTAGWARFWDRPQRMAETRFSRQSRGCIPITRHFVNRRSRVNVRAWRFNDCVRRCGGEIQCCRRLSREAINYN
jgi:hypothetical protein